MKSTIIPVVGDWQVGFFCNAEKIDGVDSPPLLLWMPVIAWDVRTKDAKDTDEYYDPPRNVAHPVSVEALNFHEYILKMPDGRVILPEDREFETEAEALEYLQRRWDKALADSEKTAA